MIGAVAIVVFGGGMVWRMTQPSEREIMEKRLASLPRIEVPAPEFPMPDLSSTNVTVTPPGSVLGTDVSTPPPSAPEKDYTILGSQEARDDLYCAGVASAEFDAKIKTEHPDKVAPLMDVQKKLDSAGIRKLRAEGVSKEGDWAYFTNAFGEKAKADYAASALRIPVTTCVARAAPLPPGDLY
ncbi:MAG: hypothetical protein EOP61_26640 [Sphingomonadales bacterium]|nr:MAG: hypothetical protein EOP61_26640 [Sphingomonadales bacterium]